MFRRTPTAIILVALLSVAACTDLPTAPTRLAPADDAVLDRSAKVDLCHIAPGSESGRLIQVAASSVDAHMAHGDTRYTCLVITEVMYNPIGSDAYLEYVELRNLSDQPIDLRSTFAVASSLRIRDAGSSDYFKSLDPTNPSSYPLTVPAGGIALVYDNGSSGSDVPTTYTIAPSTVQATVDDAAIGGGLNNSGDEVAITMPDGVSVIDLLAWDGSLANGNGLSLQRCFRGDVVEADPTPGKPNDCD